MHSIIFFVLRLPLCRRVYRLATSLLSCFYQLIFSSFPQHCYIVVNKFNSIHFTIPKQHSVWKRHNDIMLMCTQGKQTPEHFLESVSIIMKPLPPQSGVIQLLAISVTFQENHVQYQNYSPRSSKPFLNILARHSKVFRN